MLDEKFLDSFKIYSMEGSNVNEMNDFMQQFDDDDDDDDGLPALYDFFVCAWYVNVCN